MNDSPLDDAFNNTKTILCEVLQLPSLAESLDADTPLLGHVPELDSMAVVGVITAIEEHYGILVEDDEISAETFETLGTLADFVRQKVG